MALVVFGVGALDGRIGRFVRARFDRDRAVQDVDLGDSFSSCGAAHRHRLGPNVWDRESRLGGMNEREIWTAEELLKRTPAEQDAIFEASIVRDLEDAPAELVARARARIEQRIARTESAPL